MNPLVEQFGSSSRWLNWQLSKREDDTFNKIPLGSSTDPATWLPYSSLKTRTKTRGKGIVFTPDRLLLGVDIDHCLNGLNIEHEEKEKIVEFIIAANTYTEISPSKTGLHLYLSLDKAFIPISNKKAPFELYTAGRFFTVTEESYKEALPVRTVSETELNDLLNIIGYPWGKTSRPVAPAAVASQTGAAAPVSDVLELAFKSKNGAAIRALYEGDLTPYAGDESSADLALCNHLAFWTQGNYAQIEEIWLASPLGQRKKTQTRKDYRDRTIHEAVSNCQEFYTPPSSSIRAQDEDGEEVKIDFLSTVKSKAIVITQCVENICRILRKHPHFKDRIRYDEFRNILEYRPFTEKAWRPFRDSDMIEVQAQISIEFAFFQKVGKDMVYDAIVAVAMEKRYDSARDSIAKLVWDHTSRLSGWLSEVYGVPNDIYHQAVGSNWLKGLVKRIVEPGCKFDFVLVLEGEQGVKKSTSLAVLGGDWHVETTMGTDSKDFFMQFQGKAIIEFSEGETLSRTEVKRMKAIISTQTDTYRPPYERVTRDFPRRCVFAMTTNQDEYLKDETGNRRWLPVRVEIPEANIEWLRENREQLLAEAYHRVVTGKESIYEFPVDETRAAQQERRITDPNTDAVVDWYFQLSEKDKAEGVTVDEAAKQALHTGFAGPINRVEQMSIATIFREILKLQKRQTMVNGIRRTRWYQGDILDTLKVKEAVKMSHG